jgi:hypothetical protein
MLCETSTDVTCPLLPALSPEAPKACVQQCRVQVCVELIATHLLWEPGDLHVAAPAPALPDEACAQCMWVQVSLEMACAG